MDGNGTVQNKLAQLTRYMLALVTGAVVLFPSIDSSFRPPYVWNPVLYLFWIFSLLSLGFLGFAYYVSNFIEGKTPHRTAGLGNWFALIALCLLVMYVGRNLYSDRTSPLQITSLTAEPREAKPGEWVKFSAEVGASDVEGSQWNWSVRPKSGKEQIGKALGKSKVAYWQVPSQGTKKEPYIITVSAKDSQGRTAREELEFLPKGDETMAAREEEQLRPYLQDKISLELARRAREAPAKAGMLGTSQKTLVDLAAGNLHSLEAVRQDPKAIQEALDAYFSISESELAARSSRPCCSKHPGTWPFCDPSC
jgi:hypothetical protein